MKISELKELLKDKRVKEEIHKHLWIESQKVGYSIGLAAATDEWLRLYAEGWMRYHMPEKFKKERKKKTTATSKNVRKSRPKKTNSTKTKRK